MNSSTLSKDQKTRVHSAGIIPQFKGRYRTNYAIAQRILSNHIHINESGFSDLCPDVLSKTIVLRVTRGLIKRMAAAYVPLFIKEEEYCLLMFTENGEAEFHGFGDEGLSYPIAVPKVPSPKQLLQLELESLVISHLVQEQLNDYFTIIWEAITDNEEISNAFTEAIEWYFGLLIGCEMSVILYNSGKTNIQG